MENGHVTGRVFLCKFQSATTNPDKQNTTVEHTRVSTSKTEPHLDAPLFLASNRDLKWKVNIISLPSSFRCNLRRGALPLWVWRARCGLAPPSPLCTTIKNPLPSPSSSAHRVVFPQHTLTHFVTPASIDAPATTLLAARPRPPLRRCDVPRVSPSRAPSLSSPP